MATGGSIKGTKTVYVFGSYVWMVFAWGELSQSTDDNSTTVWWELSLQTNQYGQIGGYDSKSYSVNINGSYYTGTNSVDIGRNDMTILAGGTTVIPHNADGTKTFSYAFTQQFGIYFAGEGTYVSSKSGSGSGTLTAIPRKASITSAPNFTDEENPTIKYSNPAGSSASSLQACISLTGADDDVAYRSISKTGSSYTFNLTDAEREVLRNAVTSGTSRTVRFYVRSVINGTTHHSSLTKTFSLVDATPTLSPTAVDTSTPVIALTGNSNTIIKGYSDVAITFGAAARKGATISSKKVVCGSKSLTADGTISNVESNVFEFTVTDSRGNTTTQTVTKNVVNYIKPTSNLEAEMTVDGTITITASGNCFNASFGAVTNSPTVQYRIKLEGGTYGNWVTISAPSKSGNTYTATATPTGYDYRNVYIIQARVSDMLTTVNSGETSVTAVPVFDWGKEDFNFNVPVSIQGNPVIDFVIETGEEAMGSNGTWYWSKWASGRAECYGVRNYGTMAITTAWGNLYVSAEFTQDLPTGLFSTAPGVSIDITQTDSTYDAWIVRGGASSATTSSSFHLARPASATLQAVYLSFHAIGRWK